jgi:hypothetical protein
MIDPKVRKRLEMADKPVELVQVEPPYAPYTPAKRKKNAGVKNGKPFQVVRYEPVHGPEGENQQGMEALTILKMSWLFDALIAVGL